MLMRATMGRRPRHLCFGGKKTFTTEDTEL